VSAATDAAVAQARILAVIRAIPRRTLPWHRVLRSDGRIALPEGSAGWREQAQRLRAEGVVVENGRVRRARPPPDLDARIWGPA